MFEASNFLLQYEGQCYKNKNNMNGKVWPHNKTTEKEMKHNNNKNYNKNNNTSLI